MPRLTARDLAAVAVLLSFVAAVGLFVLLGNLGAALVVIAGLAAALGVISRIEFAARRAEARTDRRDLRSVRRVVDQTGRDVAVGLERAGQLESEVAALRAEIRGMRVAQQLISQTIAATRAEVAASSGEGRSSAASPRAR